MFIGTTGINEAVHLSPRDLARHLYLCGGSGTGKSSLLVNRVLQHAAAGDGLAFIHPHGDASQAILERLDAAAAARTIYLNPADAAYPIGLNPLDDDRPATADNVVAAFKHAFADSWGPRLEWFFLNAVRTLLDQPSRTLLGVQRLFLDDRYRAACLKNVRDPLVRNFWTLEYPSCSATLRADALSPIFNKLGRALLTPELRNILCQSVSTIDMRHVMDEGQILIVNLSKGALGEGNASLLGALLVSAISQAALARADTPEEERRPFHLIVDEFQNFATGSFATILSEARKYKLTLTLAHQYLDQVPAELRQAAIANCANFIALRLGAEDAPLVAKHLGWHNPQELTDLPDYHAIGKFLVAGQPTNPTRLALSPMPEVVQSRAAQIIERTRHGRGRERSLVEGKIGRFLGGGRKTARKGKRREEWT